MKLFGTLSELVAIVFRKDTRAITLRPNQAVTYTASTDIQMAPTTDTTQTLVEIDATQTLTNKTFTSPTLTAPSSTDGSFTSVDTFSLDDTDSANNLAIQSTSTLTANRTLTLDMDDGSRTFELSGDLRIVGGNSTTLTTTGATNVTLPTTGTLATLTGTETLTNKTLTSPTLTAPSSTDGSFTSVDTFSLDDTDSAFNLTLQSTSTLTAGRTLTLDMDDGSRTFELSGDLRIVGGFSTTLTETGTTNVTLPTTGTLATLAGAEALTNKTSISVDNLTLDGNTISSTNTNGNIVLDPNGTGDTRAVGPLRSDTSLVLEETGAGTDIITLQAPASIAASYTLTLPVDDGTSGQVLSTDGSGVLSWASAATVPAEGSVYSNGTALQTTGAFSGNANRVVGVNNAATATEYKNLAVGNAGTDYAIAHTAGVVTFNLPDASVTARGVVTTSAQSFLGVKTFSSGVQYATSGGTAATLNYYESTTGSTTWSFATSGGASSGGTTSASTTYTYERIGNFVTIKFPIANMRATTGTNARYLLATTALPTNIRPGNTQGFYVTVFETATSTTFTGFMTINSAGSIRVYKTDAGTSNWTNSVTAGVSDELINDYVVSYLVN